MVTYSRLHNVERTLRDTRVLSVFLPGGPADPAEQPGQPVHLGDALAALREVHANDSHDEREALENAIGLLEHALTSTHRDVRSPGWVAYVTATDVHLAEPLSVRVPLRVSWEIGIQVAPLLEALGAQRPAIVALVESRMARVYRYADGAVTHLETVRAETHIEPPAHMGAAARQGFHTGTRGRTGTDQAQREHLAGRERMLRALAERMIELAAPEAWLLFGGAPTAAKSAYVTLPEHAAPRAMVLRQLHLRATPHEIAQAAAAGVGLLRDTEDLAAVHRILEQLNAAGHGVIGAEETSAALAEHRLDKLIVSRSFVEQQAPAAEQLMHQAFDQRIHIETVGGPGGDLLDRNASGIAGRLRYVVANRQ